MTTMPTRVLGRTGLRVSPLGLAAMPFTGGYPNREKLTPDDVERAYHDFGINTFLVHSMMPVMLEGVRRLIRAGYRDTLVLISEAGLPLARPVSRALHKHLRLLGTDHLDGWLMGWVRGSWYLRDSVWQSMQRLKQAGAARAIGFSSHDRPLAATLAQRLDPDVLMIRYNAAHRGAEREVFATLPNLTSQRPGVIAYTATRWGMLLQPLPERGFPVALSAPECYRFDLEHPAVDVVWCAAQNMSELSEDVLGVQLGPLPPQRREQACRFGDAVHAAARGGRRWMFGRRPD